MKEEFRIDMNELHRLIEKKQLSLIAILIVLSLLVGCISYFVFANESYKFYLIFLIGFLSLMCLIFYKSSKILKRTYNSFRIMVTEKDIQVSMEILIDGGDFFTGELWKEKTLKIKWKNVILKHVKEFNKILIIDKSVNQFDKIIFGKGKFNIPVELKERERLLEKIKKKITLDS